MLNLDEERK